MRDEEDTPNRRDDIKAIKARVKTLEAALRDIERRSGASVVPAVEILKIHAIASQALGEQ